jgi:trk system potassium uptake protein TrkH
MHFLDALFTATSAVCVTGLIVMDTPQDFTLFGELVILALIQIGGLGYALMATLILLILGHRLGLRDRMMLAETLNTMDLQGAIRFVKIVGLITLTLEGIGAVLLTIRFAFDMELGKAIYVGVFHSISAFNNAGFSLFSNSLADYQTDFSMNVIVTTLVIFGSIGFLVFEDIINNIKRTKFRFQTHTKLVLITTGVLILTGTIGIAALEWANPTTFQPLTIGERVMTSYFQTISRTSGFTTMDLSAMRDSTLYFLLLLMAIGGSPGSMAGGIKTTTVAIVALTIWTVLRRHGDVVAFHRRIPQDLVIRALCLTVLALGMITAVTLALAYTEEHAFLALMFEVTSALGIVGMSLGDGGSRSLSALLTDFGKFMIILSMLLGRFGPLMIGLFAMKTLVRTRIRYPESRIVIG